jgi:hypothetical protein
MIDLAFVHDLIAAATHLTLREAAPKPNKADRQLAQPAASYSFNVIRS